MQLRWIHCENGQSLGGWMCLINSVIAFDLTELLFIHIHIILIHIFNIYNYIEVISLKMLTNQE